MVRLPPEVILNTVPAPLAPPPILTQDDRPQDAEQLQDALASAGVDLKAEEYNLSQALTPSIPRPPSFSGAGGGVLTLQQQLDGGKLVFNRFTLSRFVDRIGPPRHEQAADHSRQTV